MNDRWKTPVRFLVLAVTGYLCLATTGPDDWQLRAAHVDVLPPTARIRVSVDAEAVIIPAPEVISIQSSSGLVWTAEDGPIASDGYCSEYHREGTFCEEVPGGSGTFEYELVVTAARIEVLAGGLLQRPTRRFGVNVEVLP